MFEVGMEQTTLGAASRVTAHCVNGPVENIIKTYLSLE